MTRQHIRVMNPETGRHETQTYVPSQPGVTRKSRRSKKKMVRDSHGRRRVEEERDYIRSRRGTPTEGERVSKEHRREADVQDWNERHSKTWKRDGVGGDTPPSEVFTAPDEMRKMEVREVHGHQDYRPTMFPMSVPKTRRVDTPESQKEEG